MNLRRIWWLAAIRAEPDRLFDGSFPTSRKTSDPRTPCETYYISNQVQCSDFLPAHCIPARQYERSRAGHCILNSMQHPGCNDVAGTPAFSSANIAHLRRFISETNKNCLPPVRRVRYKTRTVLEMRITAGFEATVLLRQHASRSLPRIQAKSRIKSRTHHKKQ